MKLIGAVALAAAVIGAGCSNSSTTAPATTTPTSPVTETFTSVVAPFGAATHQFTTSKTGTITATLTSAGPPSTITLAIGIGVPVPASTVSPGSCTPTNIVQTSPGSSPQLTVAADQGDYCLVVVDIGNAPRTGAGFFVTIVYP
jgi:hypothetical protein